MTIVNIFCLLRQGSSYTRAFLNQVESLLRESFELGIVVIVVDGDTLTDPVLIEAQRKPWLAIVFEGPPSPPVFEMDERAAVWARAGNLAIERSLQSPSDYTLMVESDLCFPCDLVELLLAPRQDIVAPLVMSGEHFYDSWGFRDLQGRRLQSLEAVLALRHEGPGSLIELSSVGSCLLIRTDVLAEGVRLPGTYEKGLLVGLCLEARRRGRRVFCRPEVTIVHPTLLLKRQLSHIVACRVGGSESWTELRDFGELPVNGAYYEFVMPLVPGILKSRAHSLPRNISVGFAANNRREVTVLVGTDGTMPPAPADYDRTAPPRTLVLPPMNPAHRVVAKIFYSDIVPFVRRTAHPKMLRWWRSMLAKARG